ncbi:hypothetical protein D1614_21830 [Maribellus luteus]|uniref:Uncharacterized protein n=1 Tax=Maribellus luteus TaxID=2305463 RepID=A0A399SQX3_9BACT|nr:hypothetical protein D1614_21830 [Maribellus luteus]
MLKSTLFGACFQVQIESICINLNTEKERFKRIVETGLCEKSTSLGKVSFILTFFGSIKILVGKK